MMRLPLRIAFESFWPGFDPHDNFFIRHFSRLGSLQVVDTKDRPDHLFYGDFGRAHMRVAAPNRIHFSGENRGPPDYRECDWSFGCGYSSDPRHYRLPLYVLAVERLGGWSEVQRLRREALATSPSENREFCCMVVSNARAKERLELFAELNKYRPVHSGGRLWNNVGGPVSDASAFMKGFRFAIAYENSLLPGYTTEKLIQAYAAGTIPLYWGNPLLSGDFETSAIVSRHDHRSTEEMLAMIVHLDCDATARNAFLTRSLRPSGTLADSVREEALLGRFRFVFESRKPSNCSATWTFRARQLKWRLGRLRRVVEQGLTRAR